MGVPTIFKGRADGEPVDLEVLTDALRVGEEKYPWVDLDAWSGDGLRIQLETFDGRRTTLSHLAQAHDRFVIDALEARSRARRSALLQWSGDAPIADFAGKRGDESVQIVVFPDGIVVEPTVGIPDMLPLSCLDRIDRDGYDLTLVALGLPDVRIRHLGNRTDEFLQRVERAQEDLRERTKAAYVGMDPSLDSIPPLDGWAVDAETAGPSWEALRSAVSGQSRGTNVNVLESLASEPLRIGLKCVQGGTVMPFALVKAGGRIAVEASDADNRATFIFETDDIARLNAVLLVTSFRREAISAPENQLGRWALAVRTLEVVRWARSALAARVVHNDQWEDRVSIALRG